MRINSEFDEHSLSRLSKGKASGISDVSARFEFCKSSIGIKYYSLIWSASSITVNSKNAQTTLLQQVQFTQD